MRLTTSILELDATGRTLLVERTKGAVLCPRLPVSDEDSSQAASATTASAAASATVPVLSSRPTAPAVIYLDFDGETVTDPLWNSGATIVAAASGLDSSQITEVWRRVAEDYQPFNVDVTTDLARYTGTAVRRRMRCIVTQTSDWFGDAGGVAYVSSWRQAGTGSFSSTVPCWVFADLLGTTPRYIAEAVAHEVGHTLGLSHDGLMDSSGTTTNEYYEGRGSGATSWAPIMGAGYYMNLVQWSKGDYADGTLTANNTENDLALITSSSNNVAYLADDAADTLAAAPLLTLTDASTVDHRGLIERTADGDRLRFATGAGTVSFALVPAVADAAGPGLPDLDASLTLLDASGNTVATANPTGSLYPTLSVIVPAGTYYLRVAGVGEGDPLVTGYSSYGSLGPYRITGTLVATAPVVTAVTDTDAIRTAYSRQIEATGVPSSYAATGLPPGLALDPVTGLISGAPTLSGVYSATITATNSAGSGSATLTLTVTGSLTTALDTSGLTVTAGGASAWREDAGLTVVSGASAARSGVTADGTEGWFEFSVSGPGTLAFSWKVSSEADHDYVRVLVDGVETASASGEVDWTRRTLVFTSNATRVIRFGYLKDASGSAGADAAWIDSVSFTLNYDAVLDFPGLSWTQGGTLPWKFDVGQSHAGGASLRSGAISHNQESWIETTVAGPGLLSFWWRVSSQADADRLRVNLDGVEQANISGTAASSTTWAQRTLTLVSGSHLVRWRYTKNASGSSGSDAGWIDQLVYTVPPVLTGAATARATTGHAFTYQITADHTPVSYAATGLPEGFTLDPATGLVTGTPTAAGTFTITLSATNAAGSGSAPLTLRVLTPFAAWTEDHGLAGDAAEAGADPDENGLANLLEYAFGLDPASSSDPIPLTAVAAGTPVSVALVTSDFIERLEVEFTIPADRSELTYTVQVSDDLVTWTSGHAYGANPASGPDLPTTELENTLRTDGSRLVRVRDTTGGDATGHRFVRVQVSAP